MWVNYGTITANEEVCASSRKNLNDYYCITPALPEDMKKHMVHFLWHMQAEHTFKPLVFTVVLHAFFSICNEEVLSFSFSLMSTWKAFPLWISRRTKRGVIRRHAPVIDVIVGSGVCALLNELDVSVCWMNPMSHGSISCAALTEYLINAWNYLHGGPRDSLLSAYAGL